MNQEKQRAKSLAYTGVILGALVASISLFVVMLQMEKKALSEYEKKDIYVVKKEIPRGLVITEQNADIYLQLQSLDQSVVPSTALCSPQDIEGLVARAAIEEGVLLTMGMFEQTNEILKNIDAPVIAGFKADDLFQVVGGVLRNGDRIHIYTVSEDGRTSLVWESVYVQEVFNSAGNRIEETDHTTSAQRVNVYLDASDVEQFYTYLATGNLRVVKVCE